MNSPSLHPQDQAQGGDQFRVPLYPVGSQPGRQETVVSCQPASGVQPLAPRVWVALPVSLAAPCWEAGLLASG